MGASNTAGATCIHVDGVDRADVDAEHAIDTLRLVSGIRLLFTFRMTRRIDPFENVDRAVLNTRAVSDADVEIHGHMGAVDPQLFGFVDGTPDIVSFVFVDDLPVVFEVRIDGHAG